MKPFKKAQILVLVRKVSLKAKASLVLCALMPLWQMFLRFSAPFKKAQILVLGVGRLVIKKKMNKFLCFLMMAFCLILASCDGPISLKSKFDLEHAEISPYAGYQLHFNREGINGYGVHGEELKGFISAYGYNDKNIVVKIGDGYYIININQYTKYYHTSLPLTTDGIVGPLGDVDFNVDSLKGIELVKLNVIKPTR